MAGFDRVLGILLALQSQRETTAPALAVRFAVSTRTIYRDLQTLSALGVPVYAERGRGGGVRLLNGYFLPPLMFAREEAVALLLGLSLLGNLHAAPFVGDAATAREKLLAAVPAPLRTQLAQVERVIGVERSQADVFHPEETETAPESATSLEGDVVTAFLRARLTGDRLRLRYRSPYINRTTENVIRPLGIFWDRERWYLVGQMADTKAQRVWRADRVLKIAPLPAITEEQNDFDVRDLLRHAWLKDAMVRWRQDQPVRIRITGEQAERLRQDWYYRHADYMSLDGDGYLMTIGEANPEVVLPLLRWLGPDAELVAPAGWRALMRDQLQRMLTYYTDG